MGLRALLHGLSAPKMFSEAYVRDLGEVKLVCLVDHSLKMGKGKVAAQVGHASVKAALATREQHPALFEAWMRSGQQKVVLRMTDGDELESILSAAEGDGLAIHRIRDAGRTQIPKGSLTVGAIGPDRLSRIDELTGNLKLL